MDIEIRKKTAVTFCYTIAFLCDEGQLQEIKKNPRQFLSVPDNAYVMEEVKLLGEEQMPDITPTLFKATYCNR